METVLKMEEVYELIGNLVKEYFIKNIKGEASIDLARKTLEPYFNLRSDDQSEFVRSLEIKEFYKLNMPLNDIIDYNLCDDMEEWNRIREIVPLSPGEISEIEAIITFHPKKKTLHISTTSLSDNFSPNMAPTAVSTPLEPVRKLGIGKLPSILEENNDLMNLVVSPPQQLSLPTQQTHAAYHPLPSQSGINEMQMPLNDHNFQNALTPVRPARNIVRSTAPRTYTNHEMLRTRRLDMFPEPLRAITDWSEFSDFSDVEFDIYGELFASLPNVCGAPEFEEGRGGRTVSRDRGHINTINLPSSSGLEQVMSSTSEAQYNTPEEARDVARRMPLVNVGSILKTTNEQIIETADSGQVANIPPIEKTNTFLPVDEIYSYLPGIPDPVPRPPTPPPRDWLQVLREARPVIDINDIGPPKRRKPQRGRNRRRNRSPNPPVPLPTFEDFNWADPQSFSEAVRSLEPEQHFPDLAEKDNQAEKYGPDEFLEDYNDWIKIVANEYASGDSDYDIISDSLEHSMGTGGTVFEILKLVLRYKTVNVKSDLILPMNLPRKDAAERFRVIMELQARNILCVEEECGQIKSICFDKRPLKKKSLFGQISSA